jgi:hypothetical protein
MGPMKSKVHVDDELADEPPVMLEIDDDATHVALRMSVEELNELGTEIAESLNGHREKVIKTDE